MPPEMDIYIYIYISKIEKSTLYPIKCMYNNFGWTPDLFCFLWNARKRERRKETRFYEAVIVRAILQKITFNTNQISIFDFFFSSISTGAIYWRKRWCKKYSQLWWWLPVRAPLLWRHHAPKLPFKALKFHIRASKFFQWPTWYLSTVTWCIK